MNAPTLSRPLDAGEKFFWLLDHVSCMNFVVFAELDGQLQAPELQAALARVQQRHPLLNCTIRTDASGQPFGGWFPQETVSREAALAGFTSDAAYAGFAEGRFGRLIPGERADFLLVDRDPLLASPSEIRATKVREVWIGGVKVRGE